MAMTQGTLSYLYDEVTSAVVYDESFNGESVVSSLFNMREMTGTRERVSSFGSLDVFNQKQELSTPDEDRIVQQFQKTFVPTTFAKFLAMSREAARREEWGFFQRLGTAVGEAFRQTVETNGAAVFADAKTGATYTGEDDHALAYDAHVNKDGSNSQDNSYDVALSMTNYKTVRDAGRKFTNYNGTSRSHCKHNTMLTVIDLEETAVEIQKSMLRPDNASNAVNAYANSFDLIVWDELTSTTFWALIDVAKARNDLFWLWESPYEVFGDGDLFKGQRRIGATFSSCHGFVGWRWFILGKS